MNSRITPDEAFPEVAQLPTSGKVEVLKRKVHRKLEFEYGSLPYQVVVLRS
ncbi:hypothetical protein ACX80U_11340 [Arthrobacter sp. TmT3-37]